MANFVRGSILTCNQLRQRRRFQQAGWWTIAVIGFSTIGSSAVHAEPERLVALPVQERVADQPVPVTAVAALANDLANDLANGQVALAEPQPERSREPQADANGVIAGADNINPGLQLPSPQPEIYNPSGAAGTSTVVGLERLITDFRNDRDNFGQHNRFMEQTAQFRLQNGDLLRFKTGFNRFEQRKVEAVSNVPLQVGWDHKLGNFSLHVAVGLDVFDRLSASPNVDLEVAVPLLPSVTLTGVVEQSAYKSNAQTLSNHISAWRYGANLYWQIDQKTSLFALYRRGNYSDANREEQSFSRLERKLGQFSIAANLFTWSFAQNAERRKGYYSPPDFLLYSGEVAWQGDVFEFLRCRVSVALGRQRVNAAFTGGNTYQALCTVKMTPNIEADMGYTFSNAQNRTGGGNAYENQTVVGQLRVTF